MTNPFNPAPPVIAPPVPRYSSDIVPLQLIAALAHMLGGGDIVLDEHDLENARRMIDDDRVSLTQFSDPPRFVIKVKED